MAQNFTYRARNRHGKVVRGSIAAESIGSAISILRRKNIFVMDIKPHKPFLKKKLGAVLGLKLFEPKVNTKDLALFCRHLATMISCGVPIVICFNILQEQTGNKTLVNTMHGIVGLLEKGHSLTDSARAYPNVFPHIFISMLEAAEISGNLERVMDRLAEHFEKENDLREKVKSAITYPAMVLIVAIIAVAVLMLFVLPTFVNLLDQYNMELPVMTKIVIGSSNLLRDYLYVFILLFWGVWFAYQKFRLTRKGRALVDLFTIRLPVFGGLNRRLIISRFARTLSILMFSGVPLMQSFDVIKRIVNNFLIEDVIYQASVCVKEGQGIAQPLEKSGFFPPMVTHMISIGEETGNLDVMLEKIAQFYDREVENIISRLSSIIEPALILCLGGIVGFIVMSVVLPMLTLMGSIS